MLILHTSLMKSSNSRKARRQQERQEKKQRKKLHHNAKGKAVPNAFSKPSHVFPSKRRQHDGQSDPPSKRAKFGPQNKFMEMIQNQAAEGSWIIDMYLYFYGSLICVCVCRIHSFGLVESIEEDD